MTIHTRESKIDNAIYTFYVEETDKGFVQVPSDTHRMPISPVFPTKTEAFKYAVNGTRSYLADRASGNA